MSNKKHTGKTSALQTIVGLTQAQLEHCGAEPRSASSYMVLHQVSDVTHQVNYPPTCTSIYHLQGALKVFLLCFKCQMLTCHGTQQDLLLLHERNKPNLMTHKYPCDKPYS